METLVDILIFAVVVAGVWIFLLEVRFHTLKNIVAESQQLASEAAVDARNALASVRKRISK